MAKKLNTTLPHNEVIALRAHLDEAVADPDYTVFVNYPVTEVVKVAKYYGIKLDNSRVVSIPCATPNVLMEFKRNYDEFWRNHA